MNKIIFIDTNILIHFKYFIEIKWNEIVGSETATLIITSTVLKELEKLKYDANNKTQTRAKKVIKKFDELIDTKSDTYKINDNIFIRLLNEEPKSKIFVELNLDSSIQDHRIIASAYDYKINNPSEIVMIISDDILLRLTSKKNSIDVANLPDNLRNELEKDDRDKKIDKLTKELNILKQTIPDVDITFENQITLKEYILEKPDKELSEEMISKWISELELKYPKKQLPNKTDINVLNQASINKYVYLALFPDQEKYYMKYNDELDIFYHNYLEFQKFAFRGKKTKNYVVFLNLVINNKGFVPAKNIEVNLHFPDGFELYDDKGMKNKIKEPKPPVLENAHSYMMDSVIRVPTNFINNIPHSLPNISGFSIKRTKSYDVNMSIQSLKHNQSQKLDPLYVIFDSFEAASPFHIDYKIQADNISTEQNGKLNVVIKKLNILENDIPNY
jgi:rRNA-processing protein FCF1